MKMGMLYSLFYDINACILLKKLPIEQIKIEFLSALSAHSTLVLSAEPGAGKSTCLPLWLLDLPYLKERKIYLLQPRRIAAKNVASFLAQQINQKVGETIGYRLKNESRVSPQTRLEVITEGILIQVIQNDPELDNVGLIIIDEFHERSLHADLALALTLDVQQSLRDDLKLLVMSATLASEPLLKHIPQANALTCKGSCFPVTITYSPPKTPQLWRDHILFLIKKCIEEQSGSILVFLPGVSDIAYLQEKLTEQISNVFSVYGLYGDLSLKEQQNAISPCESGKFKVVLATNIAETSLTIEGVNCVIDSGLEKAAIYDNHILTNRLVQRNITKDKAIQRAGRAGRLQAGKCIRVYDKETFNRRSEYSPSEIQEADIIPLLMEASRWGVRKLADLPLLEIPREEKERRGWQELSSLKLLNVQHQLTEVGKQVSKLGCHPRFATMIILAQTLGKQYHRAGFADLACILAAILEEKPLIHASGYVDINLAQRVNLLTKAPASSNLLQKRIWLQSKRLAQQAGFTLTTNYRDLPIDDCGVLLFLAYPERLAMAKNQQGDYLTVQGKRFNLSPEDSLQNAQYLVAAELSQYRNNLIVRLGAEVDLNELEQLGLIKKETAQRCEYDQGNDRIVFKEVNKVGQMIITERSLAHEHIRDMDTLIANMWIEKIHQQGILWLNWKAQDKALLARWRWVNQCFPHENYPDISDEYLLNHLPLWFTPFTSSIRSKAKLNKLNLSEMLQSLLTYEKQQKLKHLAPLHFVGLTGRKCPIRYENDSLPIVSLPMQELYGLQRHPCLGEHTATPIPLKLELLSPAKRPIQITQDLVTFWQGSYRSVQKDMKSQYPKHFWPDDPANAQATRKTKKFM